MRLTEVQPSYTGSCNIMLLTLPYLSCGCLSVKSSQFYLYHKFASKGFTVQYTMHFIFRPHSLHCSCGHTLNAEQGTEYSESFNHGCNSQAVFDLHVSCFIFAPSLIRRVAVHPWMKDEDVMIKELRGDITHLQSALWRALLWPGWEAGHTSLFFHYVDSGFCSKCRWC